MHSWVTFLLAIRPPVPAIVWIWGGPKDPRVTLRLSPIWMGCPGPSHVAIRHHIRRLEKHHLSNDNLRKNQVWVAKEEEEEAGVAYSFDSLGNACQLTSVLPHKEAPLTFSWQDTVLLLLTQPWFRAPPGSSLGLGASLLKTPFRLSHPQNTCPHCPGGTNPVFYFAERLSSQ